MGTQEDSHTLGAVSNITRGVCLSWYLRKKKKKQRKKNSPYIHENVVPQSDVCTQKLDVKRQEDVAKHSKNTSPAVCTRHALDVAPKLRPITVPLLPCASILAIWQCLHNFPPCQTTTMRNSCCCPCMVLKFMYCSLLMFSVQDSHYAIVFTMSTTILTLTLNWKDGNMASR